METKIVASDVSKLFPGKQPVLALEAFDLTVHSGEFLCVVGPSGCGKSTMLRMFNELTRPTSGAVELFVDNASRPPSAMVFQDYSIFPWMTVAENVAFGLRCRKVARSARRRQIEHWLERTGLAQFAGALPATLSGGMRQRVSIARALAVEPEILLMDEPFAALDAQLRRVLQDELLSIWQEYQRTVVFITHSIDEALLLGDRVAVMSARPGRIVEEFDVPFPRPRTSDLRSAPEFARLEQHIWTLLSNELDVAW